MLFWPSIFALVLMLLGFLFLAWLTAIDLKLRLLPDELNIALALTGILFHITINPYAGPWYNAALGGLIGGGALLSVRAIANRIYGFETMGLGDIKLLAAGGIWLGLEGVIMALCAGAFMGVLHGVGLMAYARVARGEKLSFREMTIPAGPGFCAGILLIAIWRFYALPLFGGL